MSSVKIEAYRDNGDGQPIGKANCSGFFWRNSERLFLITNWHNVTGENPDTGALLGSFIPTHFKCQYKASRVDTNLGTNGECTIPLFDGSDTPKWLEHPTGNEVDVVAIPFDEPIPETHQYEVLNEQDFEDQWQPRIGDDGFIVGYPEGFSGQHSTAIWKRGSIASEPYLNHDGRPMLLLDTIGNCGLSGSPVIGRGTGILRKGESADGLAPSDVIGTWENFFGVYSGRMSNDGIGAQLGRIWKARVIDEIFEHAAPK